MLLKHGIFTMGDTARDAYERMIELVTLAEERLTRTRKPLAPRSLPAPLAPLPEIAPILRGACAISRDDRRDGQAAGADFRTSPAIWPM